jgi:hypothetical protein
MSLPRLIAIICVLNPVQSIFKSPINFKLDHGLYVPSGGKCKAAYTSIM